MTWPCTNVHPRGAEFALTLPVNTDPDVREEDNMARLLIVEDEQRIASFVAKGLTAEGHQTTVADDGALGPATCRSAATSTW